MGLQKHTDSLTVVNGFDFLRGLRNRLGISSTRNYLEEKCEWTYVNGHKW